MDNLHHPFSVIFQSFSADSLVLLPYDPRHNSVPQWFLIDTGWNGSPWFWVATGLGFIWRSRRPRISVQDETGNSLWRSSLEVSHSAAKKLEDRACLESVPATVQWRLTLYSGRYFSSLQRLLSERSVHPGSAVRSTAITPAAAFHWCIRRSSLRRRVRFLLGC